MKRIEQNNSVITNIKPLLFFVKNAIFNETTAMGGVKCLSRLSIWLVFTVPKVKCVSRGNV